MSPSAAAAVLLLIISLIFTHQTNNPENKKRKLETRERKENEIIEAICNNDGAEVKMV